MGDLQMNDMDILKMLFEMHHAQFAEKRRIVHGITRMTLTAILVITGWLVLSKDSPPVHFKCLLSVVVALVSLISCVTLYYQNCAYMTIARVVQNLNEVFQLYETGRYLPGKALYPPLATTRRRCGRLSSKPAKHSLKV
jgi:hypothetical protein